MTPPIHEEMSAEEQAAIEEEAYRLLRESNSGMRGQIVVPQNSIEYWMVKVAWEWSRRSALRKAAAWHAAEENRLRPKAKLWDGSRRGDNHDGLVNQADAHKASAAHFRALIHPTEKEG